MSPEQRDYDKGQSKRFEERRQQREKNKEEFNGKCCKCGKTGHTSKDCRSKETSAFEAGEDGMAETGCIEIAGIDLNALEIGAVQLLEEDHKIRIEIDVRDERHGTR